MQLQTANDGNYEEQSDRRNLHAIVELSMPVLLSALGFGLLWWFAGWLEGIYCYPDSTTFGFLLFGLGVILCGGGIAWIIIKVADL